jgi:hypothetical protein
VKTRRTMTAASSYVVNIGKLHKRHFGVELQPGRVAEEILNRPVLKVRPPRVGPRAPVWCAGVHTSELAQITIEAMLYACTVALRKTCTGIARRC